MVEKKEPSDIVIPFGKHKGRTVAEVLATDPQYADWLSLQGWVAERFVELHAAIVTRGAVSDDSPEHNLIQARFLDPLFRVAFLLAASEHYDKTVPLIRDRAGTYVQFEVRGVDVVLVDEGYVFGIEIKPSLGDDFPSVMRQMRRLSAPHIQDDGSRGLQVKYLVIDRFAAVVPLESVREMFKANGMFLITVREIEAEIPNARALLSP
jgi:hypothetical protein